MAETFQTDAIILRRINVREVDRLVEMYTLSHGKVVVMAKGIRKIQSKLAGHIEPGVLTRVMIARGRQVDKLAGAFMKEYFPHLHETLRGTFILQRCLEFLRMATRENQRDVGLFHGITDALSFFDRLCGESSEIHDTDAFYQELFFFHVLRHLGYDPQWDRCVMCGEEIVTDAVFDPRRSHFLHVYHDTARSGLLSVSVAHVHNIRRLKNLLLTDSTPRGEWQNFATTILRHYREYTLERPLKSPLQLPRILTAVMV